MTPAMRRLLDTFDGHEVEEVRAALTDIPADIQPRDYVPDQPRPTAP